jgi:hypothetical protein
MCSATERTRYGLPFRLVGLKAVMPGSILALTGLGAFSRQTQHDGNAEGCAGAELEGRSMDIGAGFRRLVRLAYAYQVVACAGRGSSAIHTGKPVGAPEPHKEFGSLNDSRTIHVESLGYPVAGTLVGGAFLVSRKRTFTWYPLVVNALLPLLLYPCVFLFSAWPSFEQHVKLALPRLFIHNAPAATLLVSVACGILLGFETHENVRNRTVEARIPEPRTLPV